LAESPATGEVVEKAEFLAQQGLPTVAADAESSLTTVLGEPELADQNLVGVDGSCACGDAGCCACGTCGPLCGGTCAGCNMGQHHFYFPPLHGYYYFRPYHHSHVRRQQMLVQSWGGNPAHPYANEVFEAVYQQYKTEARSNDSLSKLSK
jgi:hypothetical protein